MICASHLHLALRTCRPGGLEGLRHLVTMRPLVASFGTKWVAPPDDHAPPGGKFLKQVGRPVMTTMTANHFSDILFKIPGLQMTMKEDVWRQIKDETRNLKVRVQL